MASDAKRTTEHPRRELEFSPGPTGALEPSQNASSRLEVEVLPRPTREVEFSHDVGPFSNRRYRLSDAQGVMGLSCVILGSLALGLMFVGYINGHEIIPILIMSGAGLFIIAIWYGITGQYQYSWVFGGFAGFNITYALLQLGIWHSWYGIPDNKIPRTILVYAGIWVLLFAIVAYAMSRDSKGLSVILVASDIGLIIAMVAIIKNSIPIMHWAAVPMFAIAALSVYDVIKILRSWRKRAERDPRVLTVIGRSRTQKTLPS